MSKRPKEKQKFDLTQALRSPFARACGYLWPYRRIIVVSIFCAIYVSAAATAGLGTLLPIMSVLLKGDTVQTWAERAIVQSRIGVKFADETSTLPIVHVHQKKPAAEAGIRAGEILSVPGADAPQVLHLLSDPDRSELPMHLNGAWGPRDITMPLPPMPWYLAAGRDIAGRFPASPVKAIGMVLAFIACLAISSNVVKFFQEYYSDKAAVMAVHDLRRRFYDHVLHVPMSHFGLRGTSDVTSRLVQDAQGLSEGFKTILGQSIQEPIKASMAFALAMIISWKLTIFIVLFAPLMLVIITKFGRKMRRASRKALLSSSVMLQQIDASLTGIRVVKGATAERFERRRYRRIMDKLVGEQLRMSRIDAFSAPTMETLTFFVVATVVLVASYMVLTAHSLEIEAFIVVMASLATIGDSLRRVSKVTNVLQKSNSAAARIFEVLDMPVERVRRAPAAGTLLPPLPPGEGRGEGKPKETSFSTVSPTSICPHPSPLPGGEGTGGLALRVKLPAIQHDVRFENVTFTYPGASTAAIIDVDLTVPKGKCVAVVGRNGSGKTTLLALLPRFYDPQQGRILIDGVDVRHATLRSLRGQISIVTQDSVIFPGTIAENIAYGNPLATREEIESAARRAFAHDFILQTPQGYDSLLGGLGGQLSGGQKQRLCIARAILRKAPILILDEATSQVDAESENLIQQAIESLMHERTTFVIAHRFSTIHSADEIIVMDRGRIVGQGKHDELLETCDTYQQLYERQLFVAPTESKSAAVAQSAR